jgi:hypothetical protein
MLVAGILRTPPAHAMPDRRTPPASLHHLNINLLVEGQSNAAFFLVRGGMRMLQAKLAETLGFHDPAYTLTFIGGAKKTVWSGTALVPSTNDRTAPAWLAGDAGHGWRDDAMQHTAVTAIRKLPAPIRASPTIIIWLHNETDSTNGQLSQGTWETAVRYAVNEERSALGQGPQTTPVDFVYVPFDYDAGRLQASGDSSTVQQLKAGFEHLASDHAFNAVVGAQIGDSNMDGTDAFCGGMHLDQLDVQQLVDRLALTIGNQLWRYARPGSPEAIAKGTLPSTGPQAVAATRTDAHRLLITMALEHGASGLKPLSPAAAEGAGWAIVDGTTPFYAKSATMVGGKLLLTFRDKLPRSDKARLYYGWGTGRIYPLHALPWISNGGVERPGRGAAVYDTYGLPLWMPAAGLAVS